MTRIKAPALKSRLEFERSIDEIARATVALRNLESIRDRNLQKIRAEWDPRCNDISEQIGALAIQAEKYAEEHREDLLPGKLKTGETPLAMFGFRLGQPTLKLLSRTWSWEKVLIALTSLGLHRFVRVKQEVDKDAMKQHLDNQQLAAVGCRIDQADTFFVEPKEKPSQEAAVS